MSTVPVVSRTADQPLCRWVHRRECARPAAATLHRGVKTQPLSWHAQRPYPPGLVLGYAANTASEIDEGVATIGAVLRGRQGPA